MRICVLGLWHLGSVTAACLAAADHHVAGVDFDSNVIEGLSQGTPPLFEPGLEDLIRQGLASGRLRFSTDAAAALAEADVLWVTYDTPVADDDRADVDYVMERVTRVFPYLRADAVVLISSQLPVGSTRILESRSPAAFAYSPENLRLGKAIEAFTRQERIVVGTRDERPRAMLEALLAPFTNRIEWMSVESAEMTKHALNAFLATSVTFINEIATICERVGADARQVERSLRSEPRIGPRAYLSPGGAFAGGTLARDVAFLTQLGERVGASTRLLQAIRESNDAHRAWAERKLEAVLGSVAGKTVAVWGLAYKPGTDALRRSVAVDLCKWLAVNGTRVRAHDPVVKSLPVELSRVVDFHSSALEAIAGADALVVATEWPEYKEISAASIAKAMRSAIVLDVGRFLAAQLDSRPDIQYCTVGKP